ncbi:hypothetical protein [Sphingobacterium bovistauri]|uniref:Uncharacterized protein n=1 Tax=Sphingobacterium bovistauri TaxID=2781959 RepID=A0ABS7Z697_9SPHI|nr:hypothetical protein [Sphingobacterium bovistauri]MCA5004375.1 hypothetical protein [Sphingobacterium bovistauri]
MNILHNIRYWIILIFYLPVFLFAKSPKPKLLVYGSTLEAYVAALQSAASGVPTLWVNPQDYSFEQDRIRIHDFEGDLLDGGVMHQFSNNRENEIDTASNFFNVGSFVKKNSLTEANPLLIIVKGEDIVEIERKKSWRFTLSNKKSYEVPVVLDASQGNSLIYKANLSNIPKPRLNKAKDLNLAESRSVVFLGESRGDVYVALLPDLLTQKDSFYVLNSNALMPNLDISVRLAYGQVMSTIAGYCAFFKTTPDKIDLRTLQSEIIGFKGRLLPLIDISAADKHYETIQRMFLSGILPIKNDGVNLLFDGTDSVRVVDIKPFINQYYSRAQLWFVDNSPEYLTVQDALNLIKYTAFRADELDIEVKKKWDKELSFQASFDPKKLITKYEFAVLFEMFASPYAKKISQNGEAIYR